MEIIYAKEAPKAIGPYSHAVKVDKTIYISGQIALDTETMQICDEDIKLQITQVLENLSCVCNAAGGSMRNIVKLSIYLTNMSHFPLVNEVMLRYFSEPFPARVAIGVASLPKNAKVEMDAIMVLPS